MSSVESIEQPLSPADIRDYAERGITIPKYRISKERLALTRAGLERCISANPNVRPEHLVSVHIANNEAEGIVGDEAFLELAKDPGILDCVEQLIGPNIILWGCQAFCKPKGDGMEVPWHQDGQYWPIRPLATCTVWIALDDVTLENGCMRVIPGSHSQRKVYTHHKDDRDKLVLNKAVESEWAPEQDAFDVVLEAGQMSMHDVYLIHGSRPNTSSERRAGVAIRYMPASSHFDRAMYEPSTGSGYMVNFKSRPLWLLRGVDECAKNDFDIGHR